MATIGQFYTGSGTYIIETGNPDDWSGIKINPNGGTVYIKNYNNVNSTVETITSTKYYYSTYNTGAFTSGSYVEIAIGYNPPTGKKLLAIQADTGNQANGLVQTSWDNYKLRFSFTSMVNGGIVALKFTWQDSGGGGTTYGNCSAPTGVRVGASTSYAANTASNTDRQHPNPGNFYITWTGGSGGTNNPMVGFTRRVVYSSNTSQVVGGTTVPINSTTATSNESSGYAAGMIGTYLKAQVMTRGSVANHDSGWTTSTNTVRFVQGTQITYTLNGNANGGSPNASASGTSIGATLTLAAPTRDHYDFGGWYYSFNGNTGLNYSTVASASTSFRVRFWTYASSYAASSLRSMISCAEQGGWCFTCEDKANWAFQICTASGTWKQVQVPISGISSGYHNWCLICNFSTQTAYVFMDGSSKGSVALGATSFYKKSGITYNLILGNEMNSSGSYDSGYGFNGYIGNFQIDYAAYTANAYPELTKFKVPNATSTDLYAYWTAKPTYTISYNKNGGSSTPSSQTKYKDENLYLAAAISRASSVSNTTTTYTTSFNVNSGATSTPSNLTNTRTITTTTPYTFDKWAAGSTSGTKYAAGGLYTANAATTMYATWITGDTSSTTTVTTITLPTYTLKANYYDGEPGWFTASGVKVGNAGDTVTPTENQTLYLHPWKCMYVYKSNTWKKAIPYVYKDSWKRAEPWVYKSGWK